MVFLISEPKSPTCTRLAEVTGISHDSVNRFLNREHYQPKDLFEEAAQDLCLVGGTLSVDDTVLDKPYSNSVALVSHFWSGKHHRAGVATTWFTCRKMYLFNAMNSSRFMISTGRSSSITEQLSRFVISSIFRCVMNSP